MFSSFLASKVKHFCFKTSKINNFNVYTGLNIKKSIVKELLLEAMLRQGKDKH
jgi:hypothetical protein